MAKKNKNNKNNTNNNVLPNTMTTNALTAEEIKKAVAEGMLEYDRIQEEKKKEKKREYMQQIFGIDIDADPQIIKLSWFLKMYVKSFTIKRKQVIDKNYIEILIKVFLEIFFMAISVIIYSLILVVIYKLFMLYSNPLTLETLLYTVTYVIWIVLLPPLGNIFRLISYEVDYLQEEYLVTIFSSVLTVISVSIAAITLYFTIK